ncbi:ABC transporter substrate-binding protein [Vibrio sp. PP-XX7]
MFEPDYESIYMQKPDLIITGPRNARSYQGLSKIAPTLIYDVDATGMYWPTVQQQWRNLGKIFQMMPKVEAKIAQLDQRFQDIHAYNQKHQLSALTVMSSGGNLTSFGAQSRFKLIYQDFGFKEAAKSQKASRHGDLISYEFIHDKKSASFVCD